MSVTSTFPTSRRGYLSQAELKEFANINITDVNEADDKISQAEELIDSYVGPQDMYMENSIKGVAVSATPTTLLLDDEQQNIYETDYFKLCEIEILGGTGAGQRKKIVSSTKPGQITIDSAWTTNPDGTSFYRISQIGKFPRCNDVETYQEDTTITYYKYIPEAIKRAVAAQVEFFIEMGDAFFNGDKSEMQSESIGDYSYSKGGNGTKSASGYNLICPKAKMLLKGIVRRTGTLDA